MWEMGMIPVAIYNNASAKKVIVRNLLYGLATTVIVGIVIVLFIIQIQDSPESLKLLPKLLFLLIMIAALLYFIQIIFVLFFDRRIPATIKIQDKTIIFEYTLGKPISFRVDDIEIMESKTSAKGITTVKIKIKDDVHEYIFSSDVYTQVRTFLELYPDEQSDNVLYQFKLQIPWKRLLRSQTILFWMIVGLVLLNTIYYLHSNRDVSAKAFILKSIAILGVFAIFAPIFRYLLIYFFKVKEPIEVRVTPKEITYEQGRLHNRYPINGIEHCRIHLDDNKVYIKCRYRGGVYHKNGWVMIFRRGKVLTDDNYKEFIENTFFPMIDVIIDRLKKLSPDVKVERIDLRKKFR